jgi:NACalpha-BTF3-like transcription factor
MALEGANIMGQAQVYNQTQNAVNTYAKTVAQLQARREAEQKALADKLAKFSTQGLREIDKENFYKVYDSWRAKSAEALAAKDQREKFRLNSEAEKERLRAEQYVADSKAKTQRDAAVGTKILGKPYFFSEEGKKMYNKSLSAPIYSKDDIVDYNSIPLGYDKSKVGQNLIKLNDTLLKTVARYDESAPIIKKSGDFTVAEFAKIKRVPREEQVKAYELFYNTDDGFQALLEESYPDLDWDNNKGQALQTSLVDFATKYPLFKDEGVDRRSVPRPRVSRTSEDGGSNSSNYTVETDAYLYTDPKQRNEFNEPIAGSEKKSMRMVKSVGFDTDYFPLIDAPAFDVDKQNKNAKVSGNFIVGKLAYVPIEDGSIALRAVVVNSNGERYVVKPSSLPIGIRKSKNYNAALKALGSAPSKANKESKSYSEIEEQGIKAVMEKSKVTRQEAINALVAAGRLSK